MLYYIVPYLIKKLPAFYETIVAVEKQQVLHISVCVRASVGACVCAYVCGWLPGRVGVCMHMRACSLAYPACNAHAPYYIVICGFSGSTVFCDIIS